MFNIIGADQKQYGPVSADDVRQWITEGRADGRTLAQMEGGEWQPLAAFPEFAGFTASPGTPPRLTAAISTPISPAYANDSNAQILAPDLDFDIGGCLSQAWRLLKSNFFLLLSATTLVWFLDSVVERIPLIGAFFSGVLYGGLYLVYLKRIRGQPASVRDAFAGFGVTFVQLLLAGFLTAFLTALAYLLCVLPGVYLKIAWIFVLALVIDKRLEFWSAMELSRIVVTRLWFKIFALALIVFAPFLLFEAYFYVKTLLLMYSKMAPLMTNGTPDQAKMLPIIKEVYLATASLVLVGKVILLVNLPLATGALMYAYEALFNSRPAPTP